MSIKQVEQTSWVHPFRPRAPWWGGDLQTIRNTLRGGPKLLPGRSQRLEALTSDGSGDRLLASLDTPPGGDTRRPLIVLAHGLTGCEDSTYMRQSAKFHLERGHQVLRLNLRGAGPSNKTCQNYYHAGRGEDLHDSLKALSEDLTKFGMVIIGYSLGGNILLNFLATHGSAHHPIIGAATVSAPIIPSMAAKQIMKPRNWLYHRWLLRRMKHDCLALKGRLTDQKEAAILNATTVYEFDNSFIAPRNGFKHADDYYAKTAGINHLYQITLPTLLIHAKNDPWIPYEPYMQPQAKPADNIQTVLSPGGGHVGFHQHGSKTTWHDELIGSFIDRLTKNAKPELNT